MLPDVIEYDELRTGQRQEGLYYGMWNFITKLTNALGIAVVGWTLAIFGYVANQAQTAHALFGIKLFFGPASAIAILISLPFLATYPITRKSHAKVVAELEAKRKA
jgi:Na+/melibiose symporter-like transporter